MLMATLKAILRRSIHHKIISHKKSRSKLEYSSKSRTSSCRPSVLITQTYCISSSMRINTYNNGRSYERPYCIIRFLSLDLRHETLLKCEHAFSKSHSLVPDKVSHDFSFQTRLIALVRFQPIRIVYRIVSLAPKC